MPDSTNPPSRLRRRSPGWAGWVLLALVPVLGGATCRSPVDERAHEQASIHYDLGVQAMQNADGRTALAEYQKAIELDPSLVVAYNGLGLVYHLSFGQPDKAIACYQKALELDPKFTEVYTNLANVYLSQGRYDEAIALYQKALADMLYKTPYIAENNLGWCYFKKGEREQAVEHIRAALATNPRFCLGHRNLGIIYSEAGDVERALVSYAAYARICPDEADAHLRLAGAMFKGADTEGARREVAACLEKAGETPVAEECRRLLKTLDHP